ncbi:MAG: apolipoprotein N-acyltransferase, partial [Candidatus Schmidhempelia sp.]|nr:apolipoprotein N-acyltransferase [Candidatus Schmidhempelia sp.]
MLNKIILAILLGASAVFAFAPFNIWLLTFVSYAGLLTLITGLTTRNAVFITFCWAFSFFLAGTHWIYVSIQQYGELPLPLAIIILCLLFSYLSIYPMLFTLLLKKWTKSYSFMQLVIAAPAIWQLTEFLRGWAFTGFSWLQLGYSQINSPLKVYLPLFGVNFINLLIPIISGLAIYLYYQYKNLNKKQRYTIIASSTSFVIITGILSIPDWVKIDHSRSTNIALIQGNIEQSLKWNRNNLTNTLANYQRLTQQASKTANIIIWPEAAITDAEINQQSYLQELDQQARQTGTNIAVGLIDTRMVSQDYQVLNSLIVLGDNEPYLYPTKNRYSKHHLVPFGEFIPFSWLLSPIANLLNIPMSSMTQGEYIQPSLTMKGFKFTTAICYEIILPQLVWDNFHQDTDFLLTVSNDAWFGNSIGPWQHLQMAQTRAAELGRPLLRSTNNGVTAAIDQYGNNIKKLPQIQQA